MPVDTREIRLRTQGNAHVVDLTKHVEDCLNDVSIGNGIVTLFVIGSTAGITTTEFEPGLAENDLAAGFERIAPRDAQYQHEQTWHDDNGHSHVRASLLGPGVTVPLMNGRLTLGTWQQIVLIDFDTRPRDRRIVVKVIGE